MNKKFLVALLLPFLIACDPTALNQLMESGSSPLSNQQIASGLKEALNLGVDKSVKTLSATDGYYKSAYKVLLPKEAMQVTDKLKSIPGFDKVEDEAIKRINRAAEDAAKKAGPIFLNAIKGMTISDVMGVLMGEQNAATTYLHSKTYNKLYSEFKPVIVNSLNKFGALDYWGDAVKTYNKIPFVKPLNPDLADHVAGKSLEGLFSLVEVKEKGIRTDINQRTSNLLKQVFAKQDKK